MGQASSTRNNDKNSDEVPSPSSRIITAIIENPGGRNLPLPPSPSPAINLWSLPDIAHDAIASYLSMMDTHCMMETNQRLMEVYGGQVKELRLAPQHEECQSPQPTITTTTSTTTTNTNTDTITTVTTKTIIITTVTKLGLSLISRRPELVHITVVADEMMGVVARAMEEGYLNKLQELEVVDPNKGYFKSDPILALCGALANGTCPNINKLVAPSKLVPFLADAMRSRIERGCCGLKSLEIRCRYHSPTAVVSVLRSGACETLEEFKLTGDNHSGDRNVEQAAVSEWLLETKAPHLRALILPNTSNNQVQALCLSGAAPRLQILELCIEDAVSLQLLSQAIGGGAWPHIRELTTRLTIKTCNMEMVPSLVEAIGVGARELTTLELSGRDGEIGPEGYIAVARMLRDGGCPRLEELCLTGSGMGDDAVVELARALEGGAPCNTTLQRLILPWCGIAPVAMRELMESMGRGALPHLECLNLYGGSKITNEGVVVLAGAMSGGSLRCLQEMGLYLVEMDQRGAKALFQALRDHKPCHHLKKLNLGANWIGDGGVVHLAKAIEAGALQQLQELDLSDVTMGEEGFKSLVKAIVTQQPNPSRPRLEMLNVNGNERIGDGGVMYLSEMMVKGAMLHLRQLHLRRVGMTDVGVRALFQALGQGYACPDLEELGIKQPMNYGGGIYLDFSATTNTIVTRQSVVEFMHIRRQRHQCSCVKVI